MGKFAYLLLIAMPTYAAGIYPTKPVRMVVGLPAGTPRPIVQRLNAEIVRLLEIPDLKQFLFNHGLELSPSTPEQLGAQLRSDIARWGKVIRETGIKAD